MMSHRLVVSVLAGVLGACLLHAQAITEYGAATGSSAGATAGASTGKSVVNIFGKVSQTLAGAAKASDDAKPSPSQPSKAAAVRTVASAPKPAEPILPPDLAALVTGMDRADMLKKVGKPSMSLSNVESSVLVETCWYKSGADSVTVTLRDGKVAAFDKIPETKP
jgi:hypothetical protein